MDFSTLSIKLTLDKLGTSLEGLSATQARERLELYGLNQLTVPARWGWLKKALAPFSNILMLVLIISGLISYAIGHSTDSLVIAIVVAASALIEWTQQISTHRISQSLKKYATQQVKVRRHGRVISLDSQMLVPGDIVLINEGDKIAADGRLLMVDDLAIDESILTGEAGEVTKSLATPKKARPIYAQTNMVHAGTTCISGRGIFCVTATGQKSAFGQIAKLADRPSPTPPIYQKVKKLTFWLVTATLLISFVVVALGLARGNSLEDMLRFGIALIVSVIPEGLPVTLSVIFVVGAQKMAARHALVRNLTAVETLGMITAIATDKTGTLTHNQLEMAEFWDLDGSISKSDHTQLWLSVSHRHPDWHHPIERLITEYTDGRKAPHQWVEVDDQPFNTERRYTSVLWQHGRRYRLYLKGAPEAVLGNRLKPSLRAQIDKKLDQMAKAGMRVVAITYLELTGRPRSLAKLSPANSHFVGLVGFREKLRSGVKEAIKTTKQAGIEVYMLTGDHKQTAGAIGHDLGISPPQVQPVEGLTIAQAATAQLHKVIRAARVFARVLPEHKYKLLEALRTRHITAMTGDGVNDVPALTQADVGIAMGSGSDAAKEAADLVLLDDNYRTIVRAIRSGRTIYANVRKMIYYQLSTNLAEALTVVGGLILGLPLTMSAAQILWLNLVTDTTMIIPLGFEPSEQRYMKQPPRPAQESLLSNYLFSRLVLTIVVIATCALAIFNYFLAEGISSAQTMAFLTLCGVQWASAFNSRSEVAYSWQGFKRPNHKLWAGIGIGGVLIYLAVWGPLQPYLGTSPIRPIQLLAVLPAVVLTLVAADTHKFLVKNRRK